MGNKVVTLPEIPKAGEDLEDYIAALFQASGHFVEKQIIERDPADILELDIFATYYGADEALRRLIEVKGGRWGFTDLFKVVGWMQYLDLEHGAFFMTQWDDRESATRKMKPLGLDVVCFDDFEAAPQLFTDKGYGSFADPRLISLWRHSYGVERKFVKLIHKQERAGHEGAKAAKTYHRQINNGTFFARAPEESLALLYEAYGEHPKLTLGYAREIDGADFDPHAVASDSPSCQAAIRYGKHPELQACMYLEHRARLAILKAAVDYALAHPDGPPEFRMSEDGKSFFFQGLTYHVLPGTFHDGIAWLREQPNFARYATFWQQFLWGWGGFYLEDRTGEEFEWMAKYSGIPADEIPTALEAFDRFFPITNGWLTTPGNTDIHMLKMVPWIFQGIGAHQRRIQYNLVKSLRELQPSSWYTASDLSKRINCAVDFLL
ncbi:hypothetical protein [Streptomyces hydrogenans]|uniref:Uncharacterized protein n=1 Tax=Streptomyces hydrogenans TaxID=1873719 RepID=A0ABQ3PL64_9ACTN|nr:hypothetical protein [Streptomyces hydrogenans]GHG19414.1 hypothetical protein GCM10018784_35700 [Streptomyces hydrogenans]GHI20300.1 hypothetical protein Shyd_16710 [Streptomyces hydrogenans]GHI22911.1 hypothetical protein Shyd_42820 [Streptomyces hydrogenans]GHI25750.1 hypothetical protein Shyd_71210 [Streptomyces hydrogenans]GHI25812.1 hypothetical protein Shyd_71830 [Streptomyces hydrogenans]